MRGFMLPPEQGAIKSDFIITVLWTPKFSSVLSSNVLISSSGASFVSSPEKGIGESCDCFVVRGEAAPNLFGKRLTK
jgi:hypothetical protein